MSDVSRILQRLEAGDSTATNELLPLVYAELKQLASRKLAKEGDVASLQTTALVHEAYLRLTGSDHNWEGRAHFFGAAAESMRRILVDRARKRQALKRGGNKQREDLGEHEEAKGADPAEVVMVNDLLDALAEQNPRAATVVKLHYFSGFTISETAEILEINGTAAHRAWVTAKAWLHREMKKDSSRSSPCL